MLLGSLCATRVESWGAGGKGGSGTGRNMPVAEHCLKEVDFVQFNLHFLWDFPLSLWALFQSKAGNRSPFVRVHGEWGWWAMMTMSLMNVRPPWTCRRWLWNANPWHTHYVLFGLSSFCLTLFLSKHSNDISLFLAQILSLCSSVAVRVCCWLWHWAELRMGGSLGLAKADSLLWH